MNKCYNIRQASEILGIKVRTVRQWIIDGKIEAKKYPTSNRWFIEEEEIKRIKGEPENGN